MDAKDSQEPDFSNEQNIALDAIDSVIHKWSEDLRLEEWEKLPEEELFGVAHRYAIRLGSGLAVLEMASRRLPPNVRLLAATATEACRIYLEHAEEEEDAEENAEADSTADDTEKAEYVASTGIRIPSIAN